MTDERSDDDQAHAHHHLPAVRRRRLRSGGAGRGDAGLARGGQRAGGATWPLGPGSPRKTWPSGRSGSPRSSSGWPARWWPRRPELVVPPDAARYRGRAAPKPIWYGSPRRVVEEVAAEGRVVLVGRAAPAVLARERDAIHVKVVAPRDWRIRTVVERLGVSAEEAAELTDETDRNRARYHRQYYRRDWGDPGELPPGAEHGRAGAGRGGGGDRGEGEGAGVGLTLQWSP